MMSLLREELEPVLRVLKDLGGRLVFFDDEGNEFVLMAAPAERNSHSEDVSDDPHGVQVPFEEDEMTELVNRDIAMARDVVDESVDDLILQQEYPKPPSVRVRFEPLRGDISPDLQE